MKPTCRIFAVDITRWRSRHVGQVFGTENGDRKAGGSTSSDVSGEWLTARLAVHGPLCGEYRDNCPVGRIAIGIATDICRYCSSAGRRYRRLVWVIRRFGDFSSERIRQRYGVTVE